MIDLHCHILPAIDDGAKTDEDTLKMLQTAVAEGIKVITASPHHNPEYHNESEGILKKVKEVDAIIQKHQLPIQVLPGQEVRIYGELLEDYEAGKLLTSAGTTNYMLIEFPSNHVPRYASKLFYNMKLQGLQPILVHPERNTGIIENPNLLYDFVEQGVLSQITASSVTGHFGKKIQKLTFQIIEHKLTHFVASDAHNITSRTFKMKEAFELITNEFGEEVSKRFDINAHSVLLNESIYPNSPSRIKNKKFLGLF
ncbi:MULTISPECIES: tyrosine-protein phosphatase [unclassified Lactococcus]|uniref:tyrosine-protein phosphatase n=1 Tax=unclassified Lactococcus TaxID=2643510 RepID=UPI0011CA4FCE|nr:MULTISPECIES: CpsB/CapC family capsule biosynthesis tyrosine phosphatase [unclassified Lactococcus]MQW22627.1 tyrosine protein phosphatase [Lactococcus sp. dk101]TXK45647.1 tyrosine protein phosphatase [Lactococcus sp. dk310]TXK51499.1 tyrosine protein phosphatase [Lactococcus sp. dk322]